jgi:antitoxin (DNA-binding transcriptional repressor) of toxin-antitoxin stability system
MITMTIREARKALGDPEQMFANHEEVLVVCRGKPVARILPIPHKSQLHSLRDFLASQRMQSVPNEILVAEQREEHC